MMFSILGQSSDVMLYVLIGFMLISAVVSLVFLLVISRFFYQWLNARISGAPVSYPDLIGMRMRRADIKKILALRVRAAKAGFDIDTQQIERHLHGGGDAESVLDALIAAKAQRAVLSWDDACEIERSGQDLTALTTPPEPVKDG